MTVPLVLQWGVFVGFLTVLIAAALAHHLGPRTRPAAFAVAFLALTHSVYYALFLIWPDALGAYGTMLFSIALRWLVLFVIVAMLAMAVRRQQWPM